MMFTREEPLTFAAFVYPPPAQGVPTFEDDVSFLSRREGEGGRGFPCILAFILV